MECMNKITGIIMAILLFSSCGNVPVTGRRQLLLVSDAEVISASLTQYNDYMKTATISANKTQSAMVERVGKNIAKATEAYLRQDGRENEIAHFSWEFVLVKSDEVNAFCMPGGKIVVYEGLLPLMASEDELAVVVGHEVGHAVSKHSNERMSQALLAQFGASIVNVALSKKSEAMQSVGNTVFGLGAQLGVMLPYSRTHEYEADYVGLVFMAMSGYNPGSALAFWQKMSNLSGGGNTVDFLSTHPSDSKRIAEIQRRLPEVEKFRR